MAEITLVSVLVGLVVALLPTMYWALAEPKSTARETATYAILAVLGVIYLLVTGVNVLTADGTGIFAYAGAGAVGYLVVDGAKKVGSALPTTTA